MSSMGDNGATHGDHSAEHPQVPVAAIPGRNCRVGTRNSS